jgi:mono/diheme cytochrome c family protein
MKRYGITLLILAISSIILLSATNQDKKTRIIPQEYKTMKNPVRPSELGLEDAKDLWNTQCKSCHGNSGLGDGIKAKNLGKPCGNLSTQDFQSQLTEGGIYYLTFIAKNEDHKFDKKITDETDRWNIVNFIRTLKK